MSIHARSGAVDDQPPGADARENNSLERQLRALADGLIADILVAIAQAPVSEVALLLGEHHRVSKVAGAGRLSRARNGFERQASIETALSPEPSRGEISEGEILFEITSPETLLDAASTAVPPSAPEAPVRAEDAPDSSVRPLPASSAPPPPTESAPTLPSAPTDGSSTKPLMFLREGERLVRAAGSGVVIRRSRAL